MGNIFKNTAILGFAGFIVISASPAATYASEVNNVSHFSPAANYLIAREAKRTLNSKVATKFFTRAVEADPQSIFLQKEAFKLAVMSGDVAKSELLAKKVIRTERDNYTARIVLALKAFRQNNKKQVHTHLKNARKNAVSKLTTALVRGWTYAAAGKTQQALNILATYGKRNRFGAMSLFHMALIADFSGNTQKAGQYFYMLQRVAPKSLRANLAYGHFLARMGKRQQAHKLYTAFLKSSPNNPFVVAALANLKNNTPNKPFINSAREGVAEALFTLAGALFDRQNIRLTTTFTQLTLSVKGDFDVALALLGKLYTQTGQDAKAVQVLNKLPKTSVLHTTTQIQLAKSLSAIGKNVTASKRIKTVTNRFPANYTALVTAANIKRAEKNWVGASTYYTKALQSVKRLNTNHWTQFYYRGVSFERQGNWSRAQADFVTALELRPDQPDVLNHLAYEWIKQGVNLKIALSMLTRAARLKPNDGYILDSLGWAHYRQGNIKTAVKYLEIAVTLNPENATINNHLGDAYWMSGRKLEAKFQWTHAKKLSTARKEQNSITAKLKKGLVVSKNAATPVSALTKPKT